MYMYSPTFTIQTSIIRILDYPKNGTKKKAQVKVG